MPLNSIKKYNDLLDLNNLNYKQKLNSLKLIFNKDFSTDLFYRKVRITPTPIDGEIKMDLLFRHITTTVIDKKTNKRDFDIHRSQRLHWIKFHINESKQDKMLHFTVKEPNGMRTYIYDEEEKYVIILEPLRKIKAYYFLTAYNLRGKDSKRNKIIKKHKRRLNYDVFKTQKTHSF